MKKNVLLIIIVLLIVGCVVAGAILMNNKKEDSSGSKEEISSFTSNENNSEKKEKEDPEEEEEIPEESEDEEETGSEYSNLIELKVDELKKKIKNKDSFILLISQTTCSHCVSYKPVFNKVLKEHKLKAYYIEKDLLGVDDNSELNKIIEISGTPTTAFFVDGVEKEISNRISGNRPASTIEEKLRDAGYIK